MENMQPVFNNEVNNSSEINKMNPFQRVLGIIISPYEVMKNLAEKPRLLFPILSMLLGLPILYLLRLPLFKETVTKTMETVLEQQGNGAADPNQLDMMVNVGMISGIAASAIGAILMWLISSAILLAIIKSFRGEGRFKQYCSITGYTYAITLLYYFLTFIVSFFTNKLEFDISLMVLKDLVPDSMPVFLRGFTLTILKCFDVFGIWGYVVIAIGAAHVSNLPKKKVYVAVTVLFVIATLFSALYAGISGAGNFM